MNKVTLMLRVLSAFLFCMVQVLFAAEDSAKAVDAVDPAWDTLSFRIEDSRSFVGIAPVYLSVSELKPEDGYLVGTYRIEVPLKKSKNDRGLIRLPLDATVGDLGAQGGVLRGKAHSESSEGVVNSIVCEIIPAEDQTIKLAITTEHRTINFKSRYTVIDTRKAGIDG